jgi:preprotein translocase subunit SecF
MGFELIRHDLNIDFIGSSRIVYIISAIIIGCGLAMAVYQGGPRYSVDFAGGVAAQVLFSQPVGDETIKAALESRGLPGLVVQQFGDSGQEYLIRFALPDMGTEEIRAMLTSAVAEKMDGITAQIQRMEMVGPKVGADLRNAALESIYLAILLIGVYISGRFEQRWATAGVMAAALCCGMYILGFLGVGLAWRVPIALGLTILFSWMLKLNFAFGAIVSLLYDVLFTMVVLIIMGKEFDLNIIAALFTIVGYSLNDKIIVYDRIRENLRLQNTKKLQSLDYIINFSINQTLSRTLLTTGTTALVTLCLLIFGGGVIHDFAIAVLIGIITGTFSSIYIGSPILRQFGDTSHYVVSVKKVEYAAPGEHGVV